MYHFQRWKKFSTVQRSFTTTSSFKDMIMHPSGASHNTSFQNDCLPFADVKIELLWIEGADSLAFKIQVKRKIRKTVKNKPRRQCCGITDFTGDKAQISPLKYRKAGKCDAHAFFDISSQDNNCSGNFFGYSAVGCANARVAIRHPSGDL